MTSKYAVWRKYVVLCSVGFPVIPGCPNDGGDNGGAGEVKLKGFVDLHTHPMTNIGFGGKLLYGGVDASDAASGGGSLLPRDPTCLPWVRATSVAQALGHDRSTHGSRDFITNDNDCGDSFRAFFIHEFQRANNANDPADDAFGVTGDAADFAHWPRWDDITHQKMWVDWIRRTYDGGLRVMVALATNNKTLAETVSGPGDGPDDDKSSADLQLTEIKSFVNRHTDFMEVALSSADVQRIVGANKLAVVLGVEIDNIGNMNAKVADQAFVKAELDRLYCQGVRYIFPIHVIDNPFGGTAVYQDTFNLSNARESGACWDLTCSAPGDGISHQYVSPITVGAVVLQIAKFGNALISCPGAPSCAAGDGGIAGVVNEKGLSDLGEFALRHMMDLGMLIDIDHMSAKAATRALEIAVETSYPLNSGHGSVRGVLPGETNERSLTAAQYGTIGSLHGMAGVGSAGIDAYKWAEVYSAVISAMGPGAVAGLGTDTNGLALGMPSSSEQGELVDNPRFLRCRNACEQDNMCNSGDLALSQRKDCKEACRKQCADTDPPRVYRCTSNCGRPPVVYTESFKQSTLGNHSWDYNRDGVAHYGLIPEFLRAVQNAPGGATVNANLLDGADYFYRTWMLAETRGGATGAPPSCGGGASGGSEGSGGGGGAVSDCTTKGCAAGLVCCDCGIVHCISAAKCDQDCRN